ncbi:hypothetical protein [Sporolactobacillus putidus]|nr:hypothetical protein [Sporolactobacillus putidus]
MRASGEFSEKDFEFFRKGVSSRRLNPANMGKRLFAFPLLSLLSLFGSTAELSVITNLYEIWSPLLMFQWALLIIMGLSSLLFFFKWISLKFQKIQIVVLIISSVSMAFNMTFFFLIVLSERIASFSFTVSLLLYILGSILIFCLSLIRAYRLLKKGEFRENGRGLLGKQYSESTSKFSNIAVYALVASFLGGGAGTVLFGETGMYVVITFAMFVLSAIIYSVGVTEFIFVLYCKLRFPSFNVTAEQQVGIDRRNKILLKQINRLEKEKKEAMKRPKREKRKNSKNFRG